MAITSWGPEIAKEMEIVTGAEYGIPSSSFSSPSLYQLLGINSFKFFLAYAGVFMVRDEEFYQGMIQCAKLRALARVHAENGSVIAERCEHLLSSGITGPEGHTQSRPEELEAEATFRACTMASQVFRIVRFKIFNEKISGKLSIVRSSRNVKRSSCCNCSSQKEGSCCVWRTNCCRTSH